MADKIEKEYSSHVADQTVGQLIDLYRIKLDQIEDENERSGLNEAIEGLKELIKGGSANIYENDNGKLIISLQLNHTYSGFETVKELQFEELNGAAFVAMRNKKENDAFGKMYAVLGVCCKKPTRLFEKLRFPDLGNVHFIGNILLNAR